MLTILTIIESTRESTTLKAIFTKAHLRVVESAPSYSNYLKTLQYNPDIVVMELPQNPKSHLQFLRIVRNNKALDQKPFILFGPPQEQSVLESFYECGADSYLCRPLDYKALITAIRNLLLAKAASHRDSTEVNQLDHDEKALLRDASVASSRKIEIMKNHIGKLLAFPASVASILKISQDERSGATDLARIIRSDPSIATEILKVANSVYFARGGKRILDIRDAVVRIGFSQTKNIAMSLSVFQIMKDRNYQTGFNHTQFWIHCLGVAVIAEKIAKISRTVPSEEAFIGGLLHDLGVLLLNEFFNDIFLDCLHNATSRGIPFISGQREVLGMSHNDLLVALLENWNFPPTIAEVFTGPTASPPLSSPLYTIVSVAESLAKSLCLGREADCCVSAIDNEALKQLRFPYGFQKGFLDTVYHEMNMFNSIIKIDAVKFPVEQDSIKNAPQVKIIAYSCTNEAFNPLFEYLRTQRYSVTIAKSLEECSPPQIDTHIYLITATAGACSTLAILSKLQVRPFDSQAQEQSQTATLLPAKIIAVGNNPQPINAPDSPTILKARYPLDLRNVDFALAALLNNASAQSLTHEGILRPQEKKNQPQR
jgi:HD-like signal output (HDOD) protein/DNA-binding NarL/FixJ family response regulator